MSSTRLHDLAGQDGYGATYQTSAGGNLDIPGGGGQQQQAPPTHNPFYNGAAGTQQGGGYRNPEPAFQNRSGFQVRSEY